MYSIKFLHGLAAIRGSFHIIIEVYNLKIAAVCIRQKNNLNAIILVCSIFSMVQITEIENYTASKCIQYFPIENPEWSSISVLNKQSLKIKKIYTMPTISTLPLLSIYGRQVLWSIQYVHPSTWQRAWYLPLHYRSDQ